MTLFNAFILLLHPMHISVTDIEYNEKSNTVQMVSRIFVDDLELSIQQALNRPNLDLTATGDEFDSKKLISDYLFQHFHVSIDGRSCDIIFLGYEEEGFVLKCYLEVKNVTPFKHIEVTNTVITETYEDQYNMVHVTYKGDVHSTRLTKSQPSKIFVF